MMNHQMNIPQLQRIMMEFQRQTGQMEMKQEMFGDAIEDAMDTEEDEEESAAIVGQVLDSIGIDMNQLGEAPQSQVQAQQQQEAAVDQKDDKKEVRETRFIRKIALGLN